MTEAWTDIVSFGYWVERRRKALDLTRAKLAEQVGCSPTTIKKIERDERRPSLQIAELLADQLYIPADDRDRFLGMARGEYVAPLPSPLEATPPPPFAQPQAVPPNQENVTFVARENELATLAATLETARSGSGQISFVIGGPGRGKTRLVQEFARQAQTADADLIVVTGYCDAITGIGDPYLPFREALTLLTGDVEAQWAGGLISQYQARQLWELMPVALPALVQHAPDLIDTFVPGQALQERAALAAQSNSQWIKELAPIVADKRRPGLDRNRIFAQYAAVLKAIAAQRPLLLIIEDLHWVDTASSGLLFHLSRAVADSRILILGTYRPAEVALSRLSSTSAGTMEQHPLANIVSELKRQHGDIWLDLGDLTGIEGRHFVDAYLDSQPNRLDEAFREALFQRTEGQALFTVELIRAMHERGDLRQDEEGQWVEGEAIDWTALPVKVEGVIEKRIERLVEEWQTILTIASIEGETFTAEVVARVQGLDERMLVQMLSRELDKRHRLITAHAVERLDSGQRLSIYRFRHNLFQHYLYERLDEAERGYLHEAVGNALEQLYAGRTKAVAGRLARHFEIAGLVSKAIHYLEKAGDASAAVYANVEAAAHYTRALELINPAEANSEQLTSLYTQLGRALELDSQYEQALAHYDAMEKLARQRGDRATMLASLMAQMTLHANLTLVRDLAQAEALAEQSLTLARDLGDQAAEAKILWNLVNVYSFNNRMSQALDSGERALALARALNLREQMAFILTDVSRVYMFSGGFERAKALSDEALSLWRTLDNLPLLADTLSGAARLYVYMAEYDQALAASEEAFQINLSIDNLWGQAHSRQNIGYVYWDRGQMEQAITVMEEAIQLGELAGFTAPQVLARADLAALYADLGAIERGLEAAHLALSVAETHIPIVRDYVLATLAQLQLRHSNLTEAEVAVNQSKDVANREALPVFFIPIILAEGELLVGQGHYEQAMAVTDDLLATLRQFGMRVHLPEALHLQGQALLALGQAEAGRACLEDARTEAEAIGSRRMLWQILASLVKIEPDPTKAERLRQQAQEIVEYIAAHTSTPELRASFLALPDVAAVFEPIPNE